MPSCISWGPHGSQSNDQGPNIPQGQMYHFTETTRFRSCRIMDAFQLFKKLGVGARFNFQRFKSDAERLKVTKLFSNHVISY